MSGGGREREGERDRVFAAVVLAAGEGSRIGMPKALLELEGETALARVVRVLREAGVPRIACVIGARADEVARVCADALGQPGVETIVHAGWRAGRTSSLKAGLASVRAAQAELDAVLVHPVDHPCVMPSTVKALLYLSSVVRPDGTRVAVGLPRLAPDGPGRGGHPVLLSGVVLDEVAALGDDEPLRNVVRRDAGRVGVVVSDDEGMLVDVDTAEDLERARALLARRRSGGAATAGAEAAGSSGSDEVRE